MKIKSIKNSNINIKKALSKNEIIWQRYYSWKKYKLQSNYTSYNVEKIGERETSNIKYPYEGYSRASVVDGKIVLSEKITIMDSPGIYYFEQYGKFYKADIYELSNGDGGYTTFRDTYELYVYTGTEQEFSHYSKGEFIEEVKSKNKNEYPINGEKNGYWYVFKN